MNAPVDDAEDGYTLAEALAALVMIGLAVGGLALGAQTMGRIQTATTSLLADNRAQASAQRQLIRLLDGQGPFRADLTPGLRGDGRRFSFACGASEVCAAELADQGRDALLTLSEGRGARRTVRLPHARGARFVYADAAGELDAWPAATGPARVLKSIAIVGGPVDEPQPLASASLWKEQAAVCRYDLILQDCRGGEG